MGLFGKNKNDTMLALDIGTEVVKALIFNADLKENKGLITGVGRVRQERKNMQSGAVSDITGVISTCKLAMGIACQKGRLSDLITKFRVFDLIPIAPCPSGGFQRGTSLTVSVVASAWVTVTSISAPR